MPATGTLTPVGKLLRDAMLSWPMSQREAAMRAGMRESQLRRTLHTPRPRPMTLARLGVALHIEPRCFVALDRGDVATAMFAYVMEQGVSLGQLVDLLSRVRECFGDRAFYAAVAELAADGGDA